jgi:hypothetical protein
MTTEQRPLRVDFERTLVRRRIPVECPKAVVYATSGSQSRGVSLPPKGYRKPPLTLRRQTDPLEVDLDRTRHAVESPWGIEPVLSLSALDSGAPGGCRPQAGYSPPRAGASYPFIPS